MTNDSSWVVDASVALKWYLEDEDHVSDAALFLDAFATGRLELTAPHFIRYEVANALEMARMQGRITSDDGERKLAAFLRTAIYLGTDDDELLRAAMEAARRYGVTPYDGLYLALAEEMGFPFVTADRRLYRRIESQAPYARWIADVKVSS